MDRIFVVRKVDLKLWFAEDSQPMTKVEALKQIDKLRRARPVGHHIVHGIVEVFDG